jgi:selenocysteine-specific elongation factor
MVLVVDITKGMQTQTAECLVIGEITCSRMIVVLNKIDSIPIDKRAKNIEKVYYNNKCKFPNEIFQLYYMSSTMNFVLR